MQSSELEPRLFLTSDIDAALELNNANAPAVGEIDRVTLEFLIEHSLYSFAIGTETLHAFCITFASGAPYTSVNYQWFSRKYSDFVYLDRFHPRLGHWRCLVRVQHQYLMLKTAVVRVHLIAWASNSLTQ